MLTGKELQAFRSMYEILTDIFTRMKGTYHLSSGLEKYLTWEMNDDAKDKYFRGERIDTTPLRKELRAQRQRYDPLHELFIEWARAEKSPVKTEEYKYQGKVVFTQLIKIAPKYRDRLSKSIKDIIALVAHNMTVYEMTTLACNGDRDSMLDLIKLDKVFLASEIFRDFVWIAQGKEDQSFFEALSKAVTHDTFRKHIDSAKMSIACYLLWYLGYRERTYKELLEFIETEEIAEYDDVDSFRRALNRIGLTKRPKK